MEGTRIYLNTETIDLAYYEEYDSSMNDDKFVEDLEYTNKYYALPDTYDVHEHEIMRRFVLTITDDNMMDDFWEAIHRRGAFRNFKDRLHQYNLYGDYDEFLKNALINIAKDWIKNNDLSFIDDM